MYIYFFSCRKHHIIDVKNFAQDVHVVILFKAPPVAKRVCAQSRQTRGARFNPWSRLSMQPFGVFRGFLRNSRKYGLGSLRKTPTEGTSPTGPGPTSEQLALNLQPTNQPTNYSAQVSLFLSRYRKLQNRKEHFRI